MSKTEWVLYMDLTLKTVKMTSNIYKVFVLKKQPKNQVEPNNASLPFNHGL